MQEPPESYALPSIAPEKVNRSLPFDPEEAAGNLRSERYPLEGSKSGFKQKIVRLTYYTLRPLLPVGVRKYAQRRALRGWESLSFPAWPVERSVDRMYEQLFMIALKQRPGESVPFIWFWPEGKAGCALMTHDVETAAGLHACDALMSINEEFGIRSSFQLIPGGRYEVTPEIIASIRKRGFEVNIHDWNHDGYLFQERGRFLDRAEKINHKAEEWQTIGFRSAALYRNVEWLRDLRFQYDMSIPSCARLDPQRGGCCTLMPWLNGNLLELPVTTIQDYSLFHILNQYNIDIWKRQTSEILRHHGVASYIVHPDYIQTPEADRTYRNLLSYLNEMRETQDAWIALPQQVNQWWRERSQMRLEQTDGRWRITGQGRERAVIAYARLENNNIIYTLGTQEKSTSQQDLQPSFESRGELHA